MKRLLTHIMCCVAFLSCNTPQSVAEKALDLVGSGLFYGSFNHEKIIMFSKYKDIFNDCLYRNAQVEFLRKNNHISESANRDDYFQIATMFDNYELISSNESKIQLYNYIDCSPQRELENLNKYGTIKFTIEQVEDLCNSQKKYILGEYSDCITIDEYITYLEYKDIPYYILKYKIDNKNILTVYVIKIPKLGYRVCGLWVE